MSDRLHATYLIETAFPPEQAANIMAGEQSAGTFVNVPGETPELLANHGAQVESITKITPIEHPSLPGAKHPANATIQQAQVELSFPLTNMGTSLTLAWTTVAGNLYELAPFSGLRLIDVAIPQAFTDVYAGPKFGVGGTRELTGVVNRPILGTIIKPSVGLSPQQTADLVKVLCEAGLDFIKDDELMANGPHSPFEERVKAVMHVVNDHADKTGKKVMVAFNITADLDDMYRHHDIVLENGGTCVMVNLIAVGLAGVHAIHKHTQLPIHGHRNGWGMLSRHPALGMEYVAFQKFFRIAGVDHLHVNGIRNKFCESDASSIRSARACLTPMLDGYIVMPVFSSGQWAGQAPDTYRELQSTDLMYLAGGGIMAHPDGPAAGVDSIRQGWDAAIAGIPLAEYAQSHTALQHAIEMYGAL